jgi:hypothetical protein
MCGLTLLQLNNWFSNKRIREKKKKGGSSSHNRSTSTAPDVNGDSGMDLPLYASFGGQDQYMFAQQMQQGYHHGMGGHEDITDYFK